MEYTTQQIETMKELGNEWAAGENHRIYFEMKDILDIEVSMTQKKTGMIKRVIFRGEELSRTKTDELLGGNVWYDLNTNEFNSKNDYELTDFITDIDKKIN